MESSTSAVVEPHTEQMQVQKSKKKSKNKKHSTATTTTTTTTKANNSVATTRTTKTNSIKETAHTPPAHCATNGNGSNVNGLVEGIDDLNIAGNELKATDVKSQLTNGKSISVELENAHKNHNGHHHHAANEQRTRKCKSKNIESDQDEEKEENHCHNNAIVVANGLENGFDQRNNDSTMTDINVNTAAPTILTTTAKQSVGSIDPTETNTASMSETTPASVPALNLSNLHIEYTEYQSELQMHDIMRLIQAELSEPYSIYTYRYFIYNWPKLCFLAAHGKEYVGAIVCKLDRHINVKRGYIAMLAVRKEYRNLKIGSTLVQMAIEAMLKDNAEEVVLETEMRNYAALHLYENLGFVRDKRLFRYYLNGVDALRLKLWFR